MSKDQPAATTEQENIKGMVERIDTALHSTEAVVSALAYTRHKRAMEHLIKGRRWLAEARDEIFTQLYRE